MSTRFDNARPLNELTKSGTPSLAGELETDISTGHVSSPPTQNSHFALRTFLVAALILVAIAIVGYLFGEKTLTTERHHPAIEVAPESLNFGKVDSTSDFPWKLRLKNLSSRLVQVADIRVSCGCTKITPSAFDMSPGEVREVELHMNLLLTKSLGVKLLESPMEIKIAPLITGATVQQPYWTLKGTVVTPCLLESNKLVFAGADALVEGTPANSKQAYATLDRDDLTIVARPRHSGDLVEVTRIPNKRVAISVRPDSKRPHGWFSSVIDLVVRNAKSQDRGILSLDIQGEVVPAFTYYPRVLELGCVSLGTRSEVCLVVDTKTGKLVDASSLKGRQEVEIGKSSVDHTVVVIRSEAMEIGSQQDAVHLIFQANDGQIFTAEVPIWYTGRPKVGSPTVDQKE